MHRAPLGRLRCPPPGTMLLWVFPLKCVCWMQLKRLNPPLVPPMNSNYSVHKAAELEHIWTGLYWHLQGICNSDRLNLGLTILTSACCPDTFIWSELKKKKKKPQGLETNGGCGCISWVRLPGLDAQLNGQRQPCLAKIIPSKSRLGLYLIWKPSVYRCSLNSNFWFKTPEKKVQNTSKNHRVVSWWLWPSFIYSLWFTAKIAFV